MTDASRITIHIVSSVDGIIAKQDNSVSWFETTDVYENGVAGEDVDVAGFMKTIDCFVMGSRTYEHALELSRQYGWAYGDVPVVVVSARSLPVERHSVELYYGDLHTLVNDRIRPRYKNTWVAGGAELCKSFLRLKLADEIRISILPIILGKGLLFLDGLGLEQPLHLKNTTAYRNGMVELWYEIKK